MKTMTLVLFAGVAAAQTSSPPFVPPPPPRSTVASSSAEAYRHTATIELKTGERIEGAFKQANAGGAEIEVAGQPITIPLEKVRAIYFGAAPGPTQAAGPTPSQEALDALKALRSVTNSGITYRDYSQRVLDTKVKFDRYTSSVEAGAPGRTAITLAMREYEIASQAWSLKFTNDAGSALAMAASIGQTLMTDSEISQCPGIKQLVQSVPMAKTKTGPVPNFSLVGYVFGGSPASVWPCASAQVAEAERLAARH
jgi:hypothetical protein